MFNLGTKQLCLTVTRTLQANGVISIAGFGTFTIPTVAAAADKGNFCKKCSGRCVHNPPVTPYDDTKTYDIVLGIRSERVLSNLSLIY
jgi:hypothetical protein